MGRPKLLLPWGRSTLIEHVLSTWKASRVDRIVVVVRADDRELADACHKSDVDVVIPSSDPPEMKTSVEHALRHIEHAYSPEPTDVWLLAPADLPHLATATVDQLLAAHQIEVPAILVPSCQGRRGHPVLFPWPLGREVFHLGADQGVNALLGSHPLREVHCSNEGILHDLDTPEDFGQFGKGRVAGGGTG
jgi:molybdenum cofactor cytidylyltransferase